MKTREITLTVTEEQYNILAAAQKLMQPHLEVEEPASDLISGIVDRLALFKPHLFSTRDMGYYNRLHEKMVLASGQKIITREVSAA